MKKQLLIFMSLLVLAGQIFAQNWESLSRLATPPNLPQMVACNGKVYVVSGMDNNKASSTWEYNPATNSWVEKAKIPQGCYWSTAVSVDGKIYVMGGGQPYPGEKYNLIYDVVADSWSMGADLLTPRMYHSAAIVNNKIYLIGGQNGDGTSEWYFDEYDPATDSWTRKTQSPHNMAWYSGAVGIGNNFYRIGGGGSSLALTRDYFDRYDATTDSWTDLGRFRIPLHAPAAVNYHDNIILLGGYSYADYRDTMYSYDPSKGVWEVMELKLPEPRSYHKAAVIGECIYVYGGHDASVTGTLIRHCDPYLGMNEGSLKGSSELSIFPNPVSEQLNIEFYSYSNTEGLIQLVDVLGNCYLREVVKLKNGSNSFSFQLNDLPEGIYLLSLSLKKQVLSKLVIKL